MDEAKEKQATLPEVISNTHFECECGSKVLIKNKARHLKSPGHLIMKTNESAIEKEEVPKKEPYSKDYICGCGKRVFKSNKFNHNHTSYHMDWVNQYIIDTVETD